MISPRWLAEAGAVGTLGAALVAIPLVLATTTDAFDTEPVVQGVSAESVDRDVDESWHGDDSVGGWQVRAVRTDGSEYPRQVYVQRVGVNTADGSAGPQCLVDPIGADEEDDADDATRTAPGAPDSATHHRHRPEVPR